ncbi:WD repeat-containing protein 1-like [Cricetulus griseus]|uniref:WD repeat-containing protein 1-like n=1 Tax=Cricetulus griseus TaxID=10029 RepID=A0A9J7HDN3_CRIGR|nr:WD repeat-containing protein 1-like [Cricetulus griseus]
MDAGRPQAEYGGSSREGHAPDNASVHSIRVVLLKDQKKCFSIDNPGYEPEVVAVHPGGDTVAVGSSDGKVRVYSILGSTLKNEGKLLEAKGPVTDLAYSHDGAFLAVCDASKVVTVFSVADDYSENNVFYGHHAKIVCLAWSPDNEHFASGGMDMMVYVWTLSDPETKVKIQASISSETPLDMSFKAPKQSLVHINPYSILRIGAIFLWEGGSSVGEITAHNKVINCVDIKQSRPYRPATGSDDNCSILRGGPPFKFKLTIGVVLLKDQKKCFSIDNPGYEPEVVAVHPGGDTVAVGSSDGKVRVYSILGSTLKNEGKLLEAKGPVTDLAYSHDGAFLAVCDASKVVTVFSVADDYSENNVFYGHHAKIVCLAWSPDNEHFASGGMDMMVYVWTLSDPETKVKIQGLEPSSYGRVALLWVRSQHTTKSSTVWTSSRAGPTDQPLGVMITAAFFEGALLSNSS